MQLGENQKAILKKAAKNKGTVYFETAYKLYSDKGKALDGIKSLIDKGLLKRTGQGIYNLTDKGVPPAVAKELKQEKQEANN